MANATIRNLEDPSFDPSVSVNAPIGLVYDGSDNLIRIDKTIGARLFQKTFTWVAGNLTAISAWVESV
jgi:hypothetical protein